MSTMSVYFGAGFKTVAPIAQPTRRADWFEMPLCGSIEVNIYTLLFCGSGRFSPRRHLDNASVRGAQCDLLSLERKVDSFWHCRQHMMKAAQLKFPIFQGSRGHVGPMDTSSAAAAWPQASITEPATTFPLYRWCRTLDATIAPADPIRCPRNQ